MAWPGQPHTGKPQTFLDRIRGPGMIAAASLALTACSGQQSILDPAGKGARDSASIWWLMFWLGTIVFIVVLALILMAVFRGSPEREAAMTRQARHRMVILGGVIIPAVIVAVVFAGSTRSLLGMGSLRDNSDVVIDVVAHQYWWEVRYPHDEVVTANEIHIPVDRDVQLRLTATDVIHSFWVPQLHGKIDMLPGKSTSITIRADEIGTYRGQCAQFCGAQHANMAFLVIASDEPDYRGWIAHQQQPAAEPAAGTLIERGRDIYMSSACVYCHTINGTPSQGTLGPDLTHLASRETLGAGILTNNTGNLAGWIIDPQEIKPGNAMPAVDMTGEDLQALLEYLNSLD
jgi:cytochrome c oxidase subunit II